MKNIFLDDKRITLRILQENDCYGPYFEWLNDQKSDYYTGHAIWPNTVESMKVFVKEMSASKNDLVLGIVRKDRDLHIGNIGIHNISWINKSGEIKILLGDKGSQGLGFGKEAIKLISDHAFKKLNIHRLELGVHEDNIRAIRAYRSVGFKEEGVFKEAILRNNKYSDIIRMSYLNNK